MEWINWVVIGFIIIIVIWLFIRPKKCDNCGERGHIRCTGYKELDRWQGTKKVSETTASGKTKTRYVRCTYVERRYYYVCDNCGNEYTKRVEEER